MRGAIFFQTFLKVELDPGLLKFHYEFKVNGSFFQSLVLLYFLVAISLAARWFGGEVTGYQRIQTAVQKNKTGHSFLSTFI